MSWQSQLKWWLDPRLWLRAILREQDTPHSIALGTAIGIFVGFTPTVGIQVIIVLTIALLTSPFFRFSRLAAVLAVQISNPLTMVPIYWANYKLGTIFTKRHLNYDEFAGLFQYDTFSAWMQTLKDIMFTAGTPLLIGSLIVSTCLALATYPLMLRLIDQFHTDSVAR